MIEMVCTMLGWTLALGAVYVLGRLDGQAAVLRAIARIGGRV